MRISFPRRVLFSFLGAVALATAFASGVDPAAGALVPVFETAALTGVTDYRGPSRFGVPSGVFTSLGEPTFTRDMTFRGKFTPPVGASDEAIWISQGSNERIALNNGGGPALGGGVVIDSFFQDPLSGANDWVVYGGTLSGPGVTAANDRAYMLYNHFEVESEILVRTGVTGTGGTISYQQLHGVQIGVRNVVVHGTVAGPTIAPGTEEVLSRREYIDEFDTTLSFRARTGREGFDGPGLGPGVTFDNNGGATKAFEQFQSREGHVAFVARTRRASNGELGYGIWKNLINPSSRNAAIALSGVTGALGPGFGASVFAGQSQISPGEIQFDLNDQGRAAFTNRLVDGRRGVWRNLGVQNDPVMVVGETGALGPGLGPLDVFADFGSMSLTPEINNAGAVLFPGVLAGAPGREGLWLNEGGANLPIALTGDDGVLGPGLGAGVSFTNFSRAYFAGIGIGGTESIVVFTAGLSTRPSTDPPSGMWAYHDGVIQPILLYDQLFDADWQGGDDFRRVAWVELPNSSSDHNHDSVRRNNTLAFRMGFQDGAVGVFQVRLVPEPATPLLAATAGLLAVGVRRRLARRRLR